MALNSKNRDYLRKEANDLDDLLLIGKDKINENTYKELDDLLRTRELVKVSLLPNAKVKPNKVAKDLATKLDADIVQVIGRKIVFYRFSEELAKKGQTKYFLD